MRKIVGCERGWGGAVDDPVDTSVISDLRREDVVLHTRPYDVGYHDTVTVSFGAALALPTPVGITLDTGHLRSKT